MLDYKEILKKLNSLYIVYDLMNNGIISSEYKKDLIKDINNLLELLKKTTI